MVQMHLTLINHNCGENALVAQRADDGFINATAMCRVAGKLFNDYTRLKATREFFDELSGSTGIPVDLLTFQQVTGPNDQRGTWVHPDVAINLGQWLSPKFAVMVSRWVREWVTGAQPKDAVLPYHLQRYMSNRSKVPHSHFSMLNEIALGLIAPLEEEGYRIPDNLLPDGSEGRMFSAWIRKNLDVDTSTLPTYRHEFADGRVVDARLYPVEYLGAFRKHFNEVWMVDHCRRYFEERDKSALPYIAKVLALNPPVPAAPAPKQLAAPAKKAPVKGARRGDDDF